MAVRKVYLHGKAAKIWGKGPIEVDAETTQLVVQGLICRLGQKFKQFVKENKWHVFKGKRKLKDDMSAEEVAFPLSKTEELHFVPVIRGAGAVARIIIGIVLVVIGVFVPGAQFLVSVGATLIIGGVAELLAPKPNLGNGQASQAGQNPSFMFNGTVNETEQGSAAPVLYGRVQKAGSVVVSAGLTVENLAV